MKTSRQKLEHLSRSLRFYFGSVCKLGVGGACELYCNQPAGGCPEPPPSVSDEAAAVVINDHFCPAERFGCDTAEALIEAYHRRETVAALVSSTLMFAAETHRGSASVLGCGTGHLAGGRGRGVNNSSREERRERIGIPSQESLKRPFDSLLGPGVKITPECFISSRDPLSSV